MSNKSVALPHKTGGFRAYKKIAGREYQFYSKDQEIANKKQAELDALSSLKPARVFSTCGRMIGFRVKYRNRPDRRSRIYISVQVKNAVGRIRNEWPIDDFEQGFRRLKKEWAAAHALLKEDIIDYRQEIKQAKRLYIQDYCAALEQMEQ